MKQAQRPAAVLLSPVMPATEQCGRSWRAWQWLQDLNGAFAVHLVVIGRNVIPPPAYLPAASLHQPHVDRRLCQRAVRCLGIAAPWLAGRWPHLVIDALMLRDPQALASDLRVAIGSAQLARMVVFRQSLTACSVELAAQLNPRQLDLDLDDLESTTRQSVAGALWRLGRLHAAAVMRASAVQYRSLERQLASPLSPWNQLWLASADDVGALRGRLPTTRIATRQNQPPANLLSMPPPSGDRPARLLFVGSLGYAPNQEAVLWLVEHVLPALMQRSDQLWQLDVVGRAPPTWLQSRLTAAPRVCLHADAPQVTPFYQNARLVVVPLHSGGGTKLKTLEAVAHGRAVVSTHEGLRGLALECGRHCLCAEQPEAFAAAIDQLLERPALAEQLAQAARRAVSDLSTASKLAM